LNRDLDQWERVHLAFGLAAVVSGCYGIGAVDAALALTPEIERMPKVKLPSDPVYERFDLALFERAPNEVMGRTGSTLSLLRPYRGAVTALDLRIMGNPSVADADPSGPFFLVGADYDQGFFCIEGPMTGRGATLYAIRAAIFADASCAAPAGRTGPRLPPIFNAARNLVASRREAS
jgi:hypothetical protein